MNDYAENLDTAKNGKIIEVNREEWLFEVLTALWKKMGIDDIEH